MKLKNPLITQKLRLFYFSNYWTHKEVQSYLFDHFCLKVSIRTLKRWKNKLLDSHWKYPVKPMPPVPKLSYSEQDLNQIVNFRKKTGYGAKTIKNVFDFPFSESTIRRQIKNNGLSRGSKIENQRIHWVKWQRKHPNSLWQMDGSMHDDKEWFLPVIDDCTRFCIGLKKFKRLTTKIVTEYLDQLIIIHGMPREILTDNGVEYGGTSKSSNFDKWCKKKGIIHIRSRVHKPTTAGKVERFHGTLKQDLPYCKNDIELFRYRYNHIRPHRSLHMITPAKAYFAIENYINGVDFKQKKW